MVEEDNMDKAEYIFNLIKQANYSYIPQLTTLMGQVIRNYDKIEQANKAADTVAKQVKQVKNFTDVDKAKIILNTLINSMEKVKKGV